MSAICLGNTDKATYKVYLSTVILNPFAGIENGVRRAAPGGRVFLVSPWPAGRRARRSQCYRGNWSLRDTADISVR